MSAAISSQVRLKDVYILFYWHLFLCYLYLIFELTLFCWLTCINYTISPRSDPHRSLPHPRSADLWSRLELPHWLAVGGDMRSEGSDLARPGRTQHCEQLSGQVLSV